MKAERRHELQENSLIRGVRNFPQFWKDYGSKISLVIILFLLALVLVRFWMTKREATQHAVSEQLTSARAIFEQYRQGNAASEVIDEDAQSKQMLQMFAQRTGDGSIPVAILGSLGGPEAETRVRDRVKARVETAVAEALKNSSDPARQADATLLRADLYLHLGTLAKAEAAAAPTTRPTTRAFEQPPEHYFNVAAKDYTDLIAQSGKLPGRLGSSARFGMAAVHENRNEFPQARALYEEINKNGPDATAKKLAAARMDLLSQYSANPLIGPTSKPAEPASNPIAGPATAESASQPASSQTAGPQPTTSQPTTSQPTMSQPVISQPATKPVNPPPTAAIPSSAATRPATQPTN